MFGSNAFGALAVDPPAAGGPEPTEGDEIDVDVSYSPLPLADISGSSSCGATRTTRTCESAPRST